MTRKFGWCLTDHHEECRRQYEDQDHRLVVCECPCHAELEEG